MVPCSVVDVVPCSVVEVVPCWVVDVVPCSVVVGEAVVVGHVHGGVLVVVVG